MQLCSRCCALLHRWAHFLFAILAAVASVAGQPFLLATPASGAILYAASTGGFVCINNRIYVETAPGIYMDTGVLCNVSRSALQGPERSDNETDYGRIPVILTPRNTALFNLAPTIQWTSVLTTTTASPLEYLLHLNPGSDITVKAADVHCVADERTKPARSCSLPWPTAQWPLTPGRRYSLTITAVENFGLLTHASEPSVLRPLRQASALQVERGIAALQAIPLAATTEAELLAAFLIQQGLRTNDPKQSLYAEAIAQYERVVQADPTPAAYLALGDAYWAIELNRYAYLSYQSALDQLAVIGDDPITRAHAEFGQGLVEYRRGQSNLAEPHLLRAAELYAQLDAQAELADVHLNLGDIIGGRCDVSTAEAHYNQAAELYTTLGRPSQAEQIAEAMTKMQERCAESLFNSGTTLLEDGQFLAAGQKFEAALLLYQQAHLQLGEATCWLLIGFSHYRLTDYRKAIHAYDESLLVWQQLADAHGTTTTLQAKAQTLEDWGARAYYQDRNTQAIEIYQQLLPIRQQLQDPLGEARALNGLALAYSNLPDYEQALAHYRRVLTVLQNTDHTLEEEATYATGKATALYGIGGIYREQANYTAAIETYLQAEAIWHTINDANGLQGLADTLSNIGWVYRVTAQYDAALNYTQQALTIWQQFDDPQKMARTQINLGTIYHSQGHYTRALAMYNQALSNMQRVADRYGEAGLEINIGVVAFTQKQYSAALPHFEKALTIVAAAELPAEEKRNITISALNNLGVTYRKLADYEKAQDNYKQVLAIMEQIDDQYNRAATLNNLGLVYRLQGDYVQAQDHYEKALLIRKQIGDLAGQAITLSNLGVLYESQGQVDGAIDQYKLSIKTIELIQGAIKGDELQAAFASEQVDTFDRLINALQRKGRTEEAFNYTEQARARVFLRQLGNERIHFRHDAASPQVAEEQALRQKMSDLQSAIDAERNLPFGVQNTEQIALRTIELEEKRRIYAQLIEDLKRSNPEYASLVSINTLDLPQIRSTVLDDQTTLIEYFVMERYTLAWVVDREGVAMRPLTITRSALIAQVQALDTAVRDQALTADNADTLYATLIAPLKSYIHHPNLIIVPHGVLHYLPFAALWNTETERYLLEEYTVTYAPSASTLKFILDKRNPDQGRRLFVGPPDDSLPAAEDEVRVVARLFGANALVRARATESQVYQHAGQVDLLHLAAHGEFNPNNPLHTHIRLAADPDNDPDGKLEVQEVFGLDLTGADLVVLSACETALSVQSDGDELVGLTRAFLYAGTPAVITTLWPIADDASGVLMTEFYKHRQEGLTTAEALRTAQRIILQQAQWRSPYYWAAFILTGDYRGALEP